MTWISGFNLIGFLDDLTKYSQRMGYLNGAFMGLKETKTRPLGTALEAYLRRYRFDLKQLPSNQHISRLVDACDIILDEGGSCE